MKISRDGKGRYQDNIFVERPWRTVKYGEVYLKACASVLEAQRGLEDCFRFYNGLSPVRPWAAGLRPRCSTGSRKAWQGSLIEGGVHRKRDWHHWQVQRNSHLTRP